MALQLSQTENPNAAALAIVRQELTADAKEALAHLLNNALCVVDMEASFDTINRAYLVEAIKHLKGVLKSILE